jgi:hypothetical protein
MKIYKLSQEDIGSQKEKEINEIISLFDFDRMMQMAYNKNKEYLLEEEPPVKSWKDWLQRYPAEDIGMVIDSDRLLYERYLGQLPEGFGAEDIINEYKNGHLHNNIQRAPVFPRFDISKDVASDRIEKTPWSKKTLNDIEIEEVYTQATQKMVGQNKTQILEARKKLFILFNSDVKLAEKLGVKKSELNRFIKSISGIGVKTVELEQKLNQDVNEDHQWGGISNTNYLNMVDFKPEDLDKLVKKIDVTKQAKGFWGGSQGEILRKYIARTFMAIDTRIDYKDLSFEIGDCRDIFEGISDGAKKPANGRFHPDKTLVEISQLESETVAHEIGHYLDHKWAKEYMGFATPGLLDSSSLFKNVHSQHKQWIDKFRGFIRKLCDKSDISSEYHQETSEVFARFIDCFVEWTNKKGGQWSFSSRLRRDNFNENDYLQFVRILQEKSWVDKNFAKIIS